MLIVHYILIFAFCGEVKYHFLILAFWMLIVSKALEFFR